MANLHMEAEGRRNEKGDEFGGTVGKLQTERRDAERQIFKENFLKRSPTLFQPPCTHHDFVNSIKHQM